MSPLSYPFKKIVIHRFVYAKGALHGAPADELPIEDILGVSGPWKHAMAARGQKAAQLAWRRGTPERSDFTENSSATLNVSCAIACLLTRWQRLKHRS